jgi:hypothetical protein
VKFIRSLVRFRGGWILAMMASVTATPVLAQQANFGTLRLSPGFNQSQGTASGYTGGSYSLTAIANRDRNNKPCIGFGDPSPDHIMVLEKDFSRLTVRANVRDYDTTLLIQGPNNGMVRCGDESISDSKWKAGTYRIWVGGANPGVKRNYTLTVRE